MADLSDLRSRIDDADRELLRVLARRFELCHEVAVVKGEAQTQVLQPARVREVLATRTAWAAEVGVEPEFAELLFRSLLAETHRIEAVHLRDHGAETPSSTYTPASESALQTAACRIDHVTVAVADLEAAIEFFVDRLGFRVTQDPTSTAETNAPSNASAPGLASAVVDAGGVTFVLMQASSHHPGEPLSTGVHHIAIEVLNAPYVRAALAERGCALQTDVLVSGSGMERFFTVRDATSGLQLGFVSRTGERADFDGGDIQALSAAIELLDD